MEALFKVKATEIYVKFFQIIFTSESNRSWPYGTPVLKLKKKYIKGKNKADPW